MALASASGRDVRDIVGKYKDLPIDQVMKYVTDLVDREYASKAKIEAQLPFTAREEKLLNDFLEKHDIKLPKPAAEPKVDKENPDTAFTPPDPQQFLDKLPEPKTHPGFEALKKKSKVPELKPLPDFEDPFGRPMPSPFDETSKQLWEQISRPYTERLRKHQLIEKLPADLQWLYQHDSHPTYPPLGQEPVMMEGILKRPFEDLRARAHAQPAQQAQQAAQM